jgi:type II secretion system protein E
MDIRAQIRLIGDLLVEDGALTKAQMESISAQLESGAFSDADDLEEILTRNDYITEEGLLAAYGRHFHMSYVDLATYQVDKQAVISIPAKFAKMHRIIPLNKDGRTLTVAVRTPFTVQVVDELKVLTNLEIKPVLAKAADIMGAIKVYYGVGAETVEKLVKDTQQSSSAADIREPQDSHDLEEMAKSASIINYVNQLLLEAFESRATDIHIEPFEGRLRVRYRIDGILYEANAPQGIRQLHAAIISRLKVMANLDIAEKRRSQDGRCKIKLKGEEIDLRFSTFLTLFGEGMSIRLLSKSSVLLSLNDLGISKNYFEKLKVLLTKPNGIILVTGPTGCGKTTTLYACLNHLNNSRVNIVTLEDPIEYRIFGINQIQINPKVEMSFANGLRSVLRQDPDIIMVGEVRDAETAQIALRAALTGHLIFSTLHTNDAASSVTRLLDMGIEPYLVAGTLRAVVAQRLLRCLCAHCKQAYVPEPDLLKMAGIESSVDATQSTFFKGKGCAHCHHTGYHGRTGIYEIMVVEEGLRSLISQRASLQALKKQAVSDGMRTLRDDGLDKIRCGVTTIEEILRVTEEDVL